MKRLVIIVVLAVLAGFTSCKKDDGEEEDGGNVPEEVIPAAISEAFRALMPIYSGITPPDISGEYVSSPHTLTGTNGDGANDVIGKVFADKYIAFIKDSNGKLLYSEKQGESLQGVSDDVTVIVVGKSNQFTAYFITTGISNGIRYKQSTLISGTLTSAGISGFHYAFIMLEKGDDPDDTLVDVNTYRIFKDGDGLAVRNNWTSKQ